ncbi:replication initiation protein [Acidovorax sp.]|uniref:replication initiation protein n=1 Tax=Acidovorax sp. TaxID=1872122 RepID=UPI0025B7AB3B|nr:replication initiation protein [Acidovorax sp.]
MPPPRRNQKGPEPGQIQLFRIPEVPEPYKKAVQVLHSKPRAPMTLMHRKLVNAWLKNAVDHAPDKNGWWTISVTKMNESIGYGSNNRDYLISTAKELMSTVFEWDMMASPEKRVTWKASVLFPEIEIRTGEFRYQISKQLQSTVLDPEVYAIVDQNVIRQFRRAPSIPIYEFCTRYERLNRTPEVKWEMFRDMIMGASADAKSYQEYKVFKNKVLKPSIAEVCTVVDFELELVEVYKGRRVENIFFKVKRNQAPVRQEENGLTTEENLELLGELIKLGIPQTEAHRLLSKHQAMEIAAALDYTGKRLADKKREKLENPAAYLRMTLKNSWAVVDEVKPAKRGEPSARNARPQQEKVDLEQLFMVERDKDAERYFYELEVGEQNALMEKYNAQQTVPKLKVKAGNEKPQKGAAAAFLRWLSLETWGKVTPDELVAFAQKLLAPKMSDKG